MDIDWEKLPGWWNIYHKCKEFNGFTYSVQITVLENQKSQKFYVAVASGKKRKDMEVFEQKAEKSLGGMKALLWIKETVLEFPKYFNKVKTAKKNQYICIGWADSRRRNIYERLKKDGFIFMMDEGQKILIKKL